MFKVDKKTMEVTVEPGVTIGFLNRLLVKYGMTLPVVPELDVLTIGGLICGGGLESTSHKWGMFHHTCTHYEIVTADGSCLSASEEENVECEQLHQGPTHVVRPAQVGEAVPTVTPCAQAGGKRVHFRVSSGWRQPTTSYQEAYSHV